VSGAALCRRGPADHSSPRRRVGEDHGLTAHVQPDQARLLRSGDGVQAESSLGGCGPHGTDVALGVEGGQQQQLAGGGRE
jgi:hypothetical protein